MDIRPYSDADRAGCLAVFDSLAAGANTAFGEFLLHPAAYLVLEHEGRILACGGYSLSPARLRWVMVHASAQRQGLGRFLVLFCLRELGRQSAADSVEVEAPPGASPFFEKQGFRILHAGPDRVRLLKKMAVCP